MKNFLSIGLIIVAVILAGCGSKKAKQVEPVKPPIPKITRAEADAKLKELSAGLEVYYDDMKGFTIVRCRYDLDNSSVIVPYVVVYDNDYSITLRYHILYSGREPLHFDTLYIKTTEGVKSFEYKNVSILYGYGVVEEYNGDMSNEIYDVLKTAVNSGYAKIRLEGRQKDERELTQDELANFAKVFSIYEYFNSVKVEN